MLSACVLHAQESLDCSLATKPQTACNVCCMQISELQWKQRVWVKGYKGNEEGVFEFLMVKRLGGRYDGTWFTRQLTCDGCPGGSLSV